MTSVFFGKAARVALSGIAVAGLMLAVAGTASAQASYWDPTFTGGTAGGGSGTWSNSATNWWNGSMDTTWPGGDAYFGGPAGTVTLPATPTPTANNLYFNTSGYTLAGGALNFTGGTITVPTGDVATAANLLNFENNYSVQGGGTLALVGNALATSNTTMMNIDSGTTLVLANTTGTFASVANYPLGAGGTINGNLVVTQPYQEIEFMPYASAGAPASGASYTFSGSGQILVAANGTSLATHKNSNGAPTFPGWMANVDVPIVLNSSNLPFTPFDVTKPTFASFPVFGTAIGATKWSTLYFNKPISGNADAVLTCNTYQSGWGGSATTYLDAQCTYTGATMLEGNGVLDNTHGGLLTIPPGAGSLILGVSNALPVATNVEFDVLTGNPTQYPVLDLDGNNTRIGSLTCPPSVTNQSTAIFIGSNNGAATLTVSGATTPYYGFGGRLVDCPLAVFTPSTTASGTLALVKDGPNTLNLSGANTYSGGTSIYGGYLQVSNGSGSATGVGAVTVYGGALAGSSVGGSVAGPVAVQSGGEIMPGGVNASGSPLTLGNSLTMQGGSNLSFVFGVHTSSGSAQVEAAGALSLPTSANTVIVDLIPQAGLYQVIPLLSFSSLSNGTASIASLDLGNSASLPAGYTFVLDSSLGTLGSNNAKQIDLYNPNVVNPIPITWAGSVAASGTWDTNPANIDWKTTTGGSATSFTSNFLSTFSDIAGQSSGVVTIAASGVQPGSVTVSNSNTSYTFTGGPITGYTALTTGGGMTVLANTNSYTGGTYVTGGTLVAAAGDLSLGGSASGLYLDNGATFATSGAGIISSRAVYVATTGGSTDTSGIFNTNSQNSTLNGNVIVGNASVSGTFTKTGPGTLNLAGNTALTDASNSTGAVLSVQGGTLQVSGPLTLGAHGSMNVGPSGTLQFSSTAAETELFNGSVVNGKFVIDQPTELYLNSGDISGTGQICVTAPQGVIIANHSNSLGGTIDSGIAVVLNSGNLPFTKTDVTQSTINTTGANSFIVSIGGDVDTSGGGQEGTITVNGVISGSSDVNFSPNSAGGGGGGTGAPALILGASNTYTGATFIGFAGSGVQLNVSNALPIGTDLIFGRPDGNAEAVGAYLELHGNNQQVGSLCTATGGTKSQNYTITNMVPNTTSTLTISGTTTPYEPFAGTIADFSTGIVAIAKSGANTLVLNGPNNYSGGTTVAGGMLIINNPSLLQTAIGTGNVTVTGGTFGGSGNFGDPGPFSHAVPTFSVSAGAALYVGVPASGATKNSNATLYVNGNLNLAAGAALDFNFGAGSLSQLNVGYNGVGSLNLPASAASVPIDLTNLNGLTGELPIIQSNAAIANTGSLYLGTAAPAGDSYVLSYDSENDAIDLTISSTAANLTWAGTADSSPHAWDVNTTPNFSGARQTFNNGDFVTFDDTGVGGAVSIAAGGVAPGSLVFSNTAKSYTLSGGPIYGPTSLVLNGAGIVTLGSSNSYTGGTSISGGTLIAAAGDGSLGASSGTVSISGGATLAASGAGIVSGRDITIGAGGGTFNTGGLSSSTGGVLTVNAPFTVSGGGNFGFTTAAVFSGTNSSLTISSGSATLAGNGTVNFYGGGTFNGNLVIGGSSPRVNFDNYVFGGSGSIQVQDGGVVTASNTSSANGWPLLSNTAIGGQSLSAGTLGGSLTIDLNSTGAPFTSAATNLSSAPFVLQTNHNFITGIGATTPGQVLDVQASITGNADVVLGSNSNHGNGGAGTLLLSGSNSYTGATLMAGNGVVQLGASNTLPTTTDLIFGAVSNGTPTLDLHGYNQQINSLSQGGAYAFSITNSGSSPSILTISGTTSPATAFGGTIRDGSSTIELVKENTGTLELSGSNSYSGGTVVEGGTLIVENSYGLNDGSNLYVGTGNELSKFGTLVSAASPGVSPGSVTAVPEPGTLVLLSAGAVALCFARRRKL